MTVMTALYLKAYPGEKEIACEYCQGTGWVRTRAGGFLNARDCPECGGEGVVYVEIKEDDE